MGRAPAIAENAGIPYIVPPETSRRTLTLGVLHSNECGNQCERIELRVDHQVAACWDNLREHYCQSEKA